MGTNDTEQGLAIDKTISNIGKIVARTKELRPQIILALAEDLPDAKRAENAELGNTRSKQIRETLAEIRVERDMYVIPFLDEIVDETVT